MLPKLCHLDNDLEIIIIIYTVYILRSTHDLHTLPGDIFFLTVPQCALARNVLGIYGERGKGHFLPEKSSPVQNCHRKPWQILPRQRERA